MQAETLIAKRAAWPELRLMPYALAAEFLCKCGARGDCRGWRLRLGTVYREREARRVYEEGGAPACQLVARLAARLGDPLLLKQAALVYYAAIRGVDPRLLPGVDPETLERVVAALFEEGLLPLA